MPQASGTRHLDWKYIHACWLPFISAEHLNCHLRPGGGRTRARSRGQGATNMAWQSAARHCILCLSIVYRSSEFACSTNCLERCNSDGGDVIVSGEAGGPHHLREGWFLLPASMLPCWRFCRFRAHCFKFFFTVVVGRVPAAPRRGEVSAARHAWGVLHGDLAQHSPYRLHHPSGITHRHSLQAAPPIRDKRSGTSHPNMHRLCTMEILSRRCGLKLASSAGSRKAVD